jgi:PST family polysaccharide transporter
MDILETEHTPVQAPPVERGMFQSLMRIGSAHVLELALALVRNKLYAVWLGAVGVGILNQLNNYLSLLLTIGMLNTSKGLTKYVSQFRAEGRIEKLRIVMSSALALFTFLALLLTFGGLCFPELWAVAILGRSSFRGPIFGAHWSWGDINGAFLIVFATLPVVFMVWKGLLNTIIVGYKDTKSHSLNNIIGSVLALALLVPLVYFWGLYGAAVGFLVVAVTSLVLTVYFTRRAVRPEKLFALGERVVDSRLLRPVLYFGLAGVIAGLAGAAANLFVRRLIIDHMGLAANGIFQAAWGLSQQVVPLPLLCMSAYFYPRLCEISEPKKLGQELARGLEFAIVIITPFVAIVVAFREELIRLLYSRAFLDAKNALVIMMVAEFIWIGWWAFSNAMMALARLRVITVLSVLSVLISCPIIYISVGRLGYVGVAIGVVAACLFLAVAGYAWAALRVGFQLKWLLSLRVISSCIVVAVASSLAYLQFYERALVPMVVALWGVLVLALRRRT